MIEALADAQFYAYAEDAPSGLVGTIGVLVRDAQGNIAVAHTTSGIIELGSTGIYEATITAPHAPGSYVVVWDVPGPVYASELLLVIRGTPAVASVPSDQPLEELKYEIGDLVKLVCRFQDPVTLAYISVGAVTSRVKDPFGQVTTPTATFDAHFATPDGVVAPGYWATVDAEQPGRWYYRFSAGGSGQAADEGSFYVERSAFA